MATGIGWLTAIENRALSVKMNITATLRSHSQTTPTNLAQYKKERMTIYLSLNYFDSTSSFAKCVNNRKPVMVVKS